MSCSIKVFFYGYKYIYIFFRHCVMITLSKLKSLQCLDVSGTEFNTHALDIVVEELPLLESLDISSTRVDDIAPLRKCKHRLKHLAMYNLKVRFKSMILFMNCILNFHYVNSPFYFIAL